MDPGRKETKAERKTDENKARPEVTNLMGMRFSIPRGVGLFYISLLQEKHGR